VTEHYVGDGCCEHVLERRVPSVRESSARLGITMTEHNAPDIVRPAPFEDDALDLPPTIAEAYEQGMLAERARHAALVEAALAVIDAWDEDAVTEDDGFDPMLHNIDALRAALIEEARDA
jgi:hypothetical protein